VDAIVCTPEQSRSLLKSLELPGEKLPGDRSQQHVELLTECLDVFAMRDAKLGCTDLVKHSNDTSNHGAIRQQLYWVPMAYHDRIDQMIVQMKEQGIIRPSASPWAALSFLCPKEW